MVDFRKEQGWNYWEAAVMSVVTTRRAHYVGKLDYVEDLREDRRRREKEEE